MLKLLAGRFIYQLDFKIKTIQNVLKNNLNQKKFPPRKIRKRNKKHIGYRSDSKLLFFVQAANSVHSTGPISICR